MTSSLLIRLTTVIVVVGVAAIAAVVSFWHMKELALSVGEQWRSYLIPLTIDGLVVAASMVLVSRKRAGLRPSELAWGALAVGVTASIAANVLDAKPGVTAVLMAGWAPLAFAVCFELLLQQRRVTSEHPIAATEPGHTGTPQQSLRLSSPQITTASSQAQQERQASPATAGPPTATETTYQITTEGLSERTEQVLPGSLSSGTDRRSSSLTTEPVGTEELTAVTPAPRLLPAPELSRLRQVASVKPSASSRGPARKVTAADVKRCLDQGLRPHQLPGVLKVSKPTIDRRLRELRESS